MVAGSTAYLGPDVELFLELQAEIFGGFHRLALGIHEVWMGGQILFRIVAEVVNFFERPEILFRSGVAVDAPAHGERLRLEHDFHLVHIAVAALAGNATVYVSRVVEVNVVWSLVNAHPLDGLPVITRIIDIHRFVERSQLRTVALHVLVTVPAGISRRYVRMTGNFHKGVTVTTVEPELIHVDFVGEGNWLRRLIAFHQRLRSRVVSKGESYPRRGQTGAEGDFERQQVGPAWEKVCHGMVCAVRRSGELVKFFTSDARCSTIGRTRAARECQPDLFMQCEKRNFD